MMKSSVKYKLFYTPSAQKDIGKLQPQIKKRLGRKINLYSKSPLHYAGKFTSYEIKAYRWRMGNYRIIFSFRGNTIFVLRVRHRRESYR